MTDPQYTPKQVLPSEILAALHEIRRIHSEKYFAQFNLAGESFMEMMKANAKLQACEEVFSEIYEKLNKLILA